MKELKMFKVNFIYSILFFIIAIINFIPLVLGGWIYLLGFILFLLLSAFYFFQSSMKLMIDTKNDRIILSTFFRKKEARLSGVFSIEALNKRILNYVTLYNENKEDILSFPIRLLKCNFISYDNFYKFFDNIKNADFGLLQIDDQEILKTNKRTVELFWLTISYWILIDVTYLLGMINRLPLFPIIINVLEVPAFVLFFIIILLIIISLFIKSKHYYFRNIISVICVVAIPLGSIIMFFAEPGTLYVSKTDDINNYELSFEENDRPSYFPEKISSDMKVIDFYYYSNDYYDGVCEFYLEVMIKDENKFMEIYDSYDKIQSLYNSKYEEYILYDTLDIDDNNKYIKSATIEKIIFSKDEQIVIYVSINAYDPYLIEDSFYINRLNICNIN